MINIFQRGRSKRELKEAIVQGLRDGVLEEDRYGKIWLPQWLPVHNGEVFEPKPVD